IGVPVAENRGEMDDVRDTLNRLAKRRTIEEVSLAWDHPRRHVLPSAHKGATNHALLDEPRQQAGPDQAGHASYQDCHTSLPFRELFQAFGSGLENVDCPLDGGIVHAVER